LTAQQAPHHGDRASGPRFKSSRLELAVAKWGNSLAVRLPAESTRQLRVGEGDIPMAEVATGGHLILAPEGSAITRATARGLRQFVGRQKETVPVVEFASAAAIKLRTGQATASLVKQAVARMHEFARRHCTVAIPGRQNFRRASELARGRCRGETGGRRRASLCHRREPEHAGDPLPRPVDDRERQVVGNDGCGNLNLE